MDNVNVAVKKYRDKAAGHRTGALSRRPRDISDSIKANLHKFGYGNQRFPTSHIAKIAETAILLPANTV